MGKVGRLCEIIHLVVNAGPNAFSVFHNFDTTLT